MAFEPTIKIIGARQNNLKSISLDIPLKQLTVITGVSGSGKSSLAFDTLYAEGSRRYMESLTTYARQFLEQIPRPAVDAIHSLPPAIALEQRNSIVTSRTLVAHMTEIYDYFRLFFSSIGRQRCKNCGHDEVRVNGPESVADSILALPLGTRLYVVAPLVGLEPVASEDESDEEDDDASPFLGQSLYKRGFQRLLVRREVIDLASAEGQIFNPNDKDAFVLVDRLVVNEELVAERSRLADSLETAFLHGNGYIEVHSPEGDILLRAREAYSCLKCGEAHSPPSAPLFSSNSPIGACSGCSGFGETLELDEELVVPDPSRTFRDGALDPFSKPSHKDWETDILRALDKRGVSAGMRYKDLKPETKKWLWEGEGTFPGVRGYFEQLKQWRYKLHVRVFIRRYQTQRICLACHGSRLSSAPLRFTIGGGAEEKNIAQVLGLSVGETLAWLNGLELSEQEREKSRELVRQICERLEFLESVGVGYLRLDRKANTLSGGEYQRICLSAQLGSKLSNTLYVLDEPSIGLHPADTARLVQVLEQLRRHGNTVVVVEHDADIMRAADFLVELGPKAGREGGELIEHGTKAKFLASRKSLTARYLNRELSLKAPALRRPPTHFLELTNCSEHNLQGIDLKIPLGLLVAVTGVSGSGKSTLIHDTLYRSLARLVNREAIPSHEVGKFDEIRGVQRVQSVALLDQNPIGRSLRSNPATYLKIYDEIRRVMSCQPLSARYGLTAADFSFNVDGGRCANCKGEGSVEVDMHFMADIRLPCEDCGGKRFKGHVLEVRYKTKNIDEILHTTVADAFALFSDLPAVTNKLELLRDVGLDYLQLGQGLDTLSGGECQRLKVAHTLSQSERLPGSSRLYIFDEPTTGLHMHDVKRLAQLFHNLVDQKHSVVFIEHNMDLVAQADWVIDVGPGGGSAGGTIVAEGPPEAVSRIRQSLTGAYLKAALV